MSCGHIWDAYTWQKPCHCNAMHWSLPGHQCHNERASKIAPKLPPLPSACRWTWHSLVSWTWSYFFPPDDHHSDLEYVKLDLHPFFCQQVSNLAFLIESYFILTLFCILVTSLAFCIELDLNFTFLCMQVAIMVFCTDLDFIVNPSVWRWSPWPSGGNWTWSFITLFFLLVTFLAF